MSTFERFKHAPPFDLQASKKTQIKEINFYNILYTLDQIL